MPLVTRKRGTPEGRSPSRLRVNGTDFIIGNLVNHKHPPPYVFHKSIILKVVKVLCFDRLLKEYQTKGLIDGPFVSDGWLRIQGTAPKKESAAVELPRFKVRKIAYNLF